MSPIFVRPVREQLEHDRLIRFLQDKYKRRKFDVAINVGDEQAAPVKLGTQTFFPDLVLTEGKRLAGLVEVESGESVNNLEAMAQWVHFSRARVPFHLYVPVQGYDAARRLCEQNQAAVAEIWTYRPAMEGFDLVRMFVNAAAAAREARRAADGGGAPAEKEKPAAKPAKTAPPAPKAATPKAATPKAATPKAAAPKAAAPRAAKPVKRAPTVKAAPPAKAKPPKPASKSAKKGARPRKGTGKR